jgi:hypothetical protein
MLGHPGEDIPHENVICNIDENGRERLKYLSDHLLLPHNFLKLK